jgi:hypothetical protein
MSQKAEEGLFLRGQVVAEALALGREEVGELVNGGLVLARVAIGPGRSRRLAALARAREFAAANPRLKGGGS